MNVKNANDVLRIFVVNRNPVVALFHQRVGERTYDLHQRECDRGNDNSSVFRSPELIMNTRRLQAGLTLIETVVWIAIFIAAMLAVTSSVLYFYRTSNYAIQQASATASAQHGMDLMVRTIREASYASNGAYPIVSLAANDFKFYAEIDGDPGVEEVHYYISGNSLMKGTIEPSGDPAVYTGAEAISKVSDYIHNLDQATTTFTYYDKNGTKINNYTKIGDVRFVTANLLVDVDTSKSPIPLSLRSSAALRNLVGH